MGTREGLCHDFEDNEPYHKGHIRPRKEIAMPHREEQRRKEAIARDLADDTIEDICQAMACSKSWLYTWRGRYPADDPNWATELTRRPRTNPAKTPHTIEQAVVSLRHALIQNGQGCGAASIQQALTQPAREPVPSRRTIYRIRQRHEKEGQ